MIGRFAGSTLIALLLALLTAPALADDRRGGEAGVVVGAFSPDELMTGDSSSAEPTLGLRGGAVFSRRWGWFVDALYSDVSTRNGLGDARTVIGRTGMDYLCNPGKNTRWFFSFGAGWMVVDYEDASSQDFHNPLAAVGFGQRIRLGASNTRLRWELRGEHTLDHARLTDDLVQGHATLAFTWGPSGIGQQRAVADADTDGVRDKKDQCPQTPEGATVDPRGCPLDSDTDGVPDGIDACPRTKKDDPVGLDGCPADSDGDGVPDMTDVCDDTPTTAKTDAWGCPEDADGDSVFDGIDRCARTPLGARVDDRGCPIDTDTDGVFDGLDRCPRTPRGVRVDRTGCALDSDGDGVHDGLDACPDTAPGARVVDARGCVRTAPLFEEGQTQLVLTGIWFASDDAGLNAEARETLDRVARSLVENSESRIEIGAHTDSTGEADYNEALSKRRAEAVRDYLISKGVAADRLVARGYGESRPLTDNDTPQGRARNRRVEMKAID